jgi:MFS transporter, Spinster family, sphingosine-1-phosphate transporter
VSAPPRSRWSSIDSPGALLAILALMNIINYADRALLSPLAPLLAERPEHGGLGLTNSEIGLLASAFMVVHSLASVPLGILADRYMRTRLIAAGVAVWSLATATAGFARSFAQIFVARASVGIGEATYAPAATALISDRFSPQARARALGIFQLGSVLGGGVAQIVGGQVAGAWGWRGAFFVFGLPGLLVAISILFVAETPRVAVGAAERRPSQSLAIEARGLARSPAFVWINLAGIFITFFVGALIVFANKFVLDTHYGGEKRFNAEVSTSLGVVGAIASILGVLAGSFVADRIERKRQGTGRLLTVAISAFATIPCATAAMFLEERVLLYTSLGLGVFFATWYLGPIMAALHDAVPADKRGIATGTYLLLVHLLGDAISPYIVGQIADRFGGLRNGLLAATAMLLVGGACALRAIGAIRRRTPATSPSS